MADIPHRCAVCRCPVHGVEDGVAFGVAGKFLFTTCREHAPLVRAGAKTAMKTATAGVITLIDRKLPLLGQILHEVRTLRDKELKA